MKNGSYLDMTIPVRFLSYKFSLHMPFKNGKRDINIKVIFQRFSCDFFMYIKDTAT